jgi:hypothetical protein
MKVFIWEGVLQEAAPGVALAVAETEEQARALLLAHEDFNGPTGTKWSEDLERDLAALAGPPAEVHDAAGFTFTRRGGG